MHSRTWRRRVVLEVHDLRLVRVRNTLLAVRERSPHCRIIDIMLAVAQAFSDHEVLHVPGSLLECTSSRNEQLHCASRWTSRLALTRYRTYLRLSGTTWAARLCGVRQDAASSQ